MTPEDRLKAARKQVRLAARSELAPGMTEARLKEVRAQLGKAQLEIGNARRETDDAEVLDS